MKIYFFSLLLLPLCAFSGEYDWKVTNDWSPSFEKKFSEFIKTVGDSGCNTLNKCLTSSASNPLYVNKTPKSKPFPADCADLPFALRMYFAWMEELPFDYVSEPVQANPDQETSSDIRYTKYGNKPGKIRSLTKGNVYNAYTEIDNMRNSVSTATYRMHYQYVSDFYPPIVDTKNIKPGTVAYDPSGHAAIVYRIEKDGRIRMMDAHPDNSLTRITFDKKFSLSRPAHGAGLKNWRPELSTKPTKDLEGFSDIQFQKKFEIADEEMDYYDYVRTMLAGGSLKFDPLVEIKNTMSEICSNINDRVVAVNAAIKNGIQKKSHPAQLPINIYGTTGEWEDFSTPSRDARLKVAFVELTSNIERFLKMYQEGSSKISFTPVKDKAALTCGADKECILASNLMSAYEEVSQSKACQFKYTNSNGEEKNFGYADVAERLFDLSFDPYHCIELRWGAQSKEELASCQDDTNKLDWYKAEQGLRNQTERTYDQKMNFDSTGTQKNLGVANAPNVDLWDLLKSKLK